MEKKNKNIGQKILNILLDILIVIFGIILLIFIYNNIQTKILDNDYSSIFGYSTFEVKTGSMGEVIEVGDWIVVKQSNSIELNDIVTFKKDDSFITHRVIEEYNGTYVTKGDANTAKDDPISKNQIIGKVVKVLPRFGIIRKTILNPIVLVSLIITLYLIGYVFRNLKTVDNNKVSIKSKIDDLITSVLNKLFNKKNLIKKENVVQENKKQKQIIEVIEEREIESNTPYLLDDELDDDKDDIVEEIEQVEEMENNNSTDLQDELEKTMFFRMVSVNKDDVDNVYANKVEEEKQSEKLDKMTDEEVDAKVNNEIDDCITHLKSKKKKFKNIVDKIIFVKRDEIEYIINIFNKKEKLKINESTIKEELIETYIDTRYYSGCKDIQIDFNSKNVVSKIDNSLKEKATNMIAKYKGSDNKYADKVEKYTKYLMLINSLEQLNNLFVDIPSKRENYKNKLLVAFKSDLTGANELIEMVNAIIITQKVHNKIISQSLEKLSSNTFKLNVEELGKKNIQCVRLDHNITFSKVYSDYIIDKTYSEGIIAEDKVMVMITMILSKVISNALSGEFKEKFIIYLPGCVYEKTNKLIKIMDMFDDELAKNCIILANNYNDFVSNKSKIKKYRKAGYNFAVIFDEKDVIKSKDTACLSTASYLFITKKCNKKIALTDCISDDVKENIIYEDITEKIID